MKISEVISGLAGKRFSATELIQDKLSKIEATKNLNAFLSVFGESALQKARAVDDKISKGEELRPLEGVPYSVKDNYNVTEGETTAASNILRGYKAPYNATVVERLDGAGAVNLGKTNHDAFGHGASTENSDFGPTKNPWDEKRVSGGSSGGSAAAVAAGLVSFSMGSDTGGSIRLPSSYCGVVGLKPTYGRVSRNGVIAMGSSLDCMGPISGTVEDAATILSLTAGRDPYDATASSEPPVDYNYFLNKDIKGLKVGLPRHFFLSDLEPEVRKIFNRSVKTLEKLGARVVEVELPHTKYSLPAYYIICPAEVSSNLGRYDGIRYGHSAKNPQDLLEVYERTREEGFGDEPKRRILVGTFSLSSGYYEAYYGKAQKIRQLITSDYEKAFEKADVLVSPVSSTTAFKFGQKSDPIDMYLTDLYTVSMNLAGVPAISVPAGLSKGLPVGVQFVGKWFDEARMLNIAHQFEKKVSLKLAPTEVK